VEKLLLELKKIWKTKDYEDGNANHAWEKLKKTFDPVSAPKSERMFKESKLGRNEDPEIRINNLEDLQVKLEVMGSNMTDEQFLIQVLNKLTGDYELQMTRMEKGIGNKENQLSIDALKEDLNLRYERLSSKSESTRNDDYGQEKALFVTQFKGKCRNCGKLGQKSAQCKSKAVQEYKEIICNYCKKSGHLKTQCFKLLRKNQNQAEGNQGGTRGIAGFAADVVLTTMTANDGIDSKIWIGDSGASCHYCNSEEGLYNYTTISEEITVGNGNKMLAKKVGSLRCMYWSVSLIFLTRVLIEYSLIYVHRLAILNVRTVMRTTMF
jgi:gag-polypeptide of LTR copia-type